MEPFLPLASCSGVGGGSLADGAADAAGCDAVGAGSVWTAEGTGFAKTDEATGACVVDSRAQAVPTIRVKARTPIRFASLMDAAGYHRGTK